MRWLEPEVTEPAEDTALPLSLDDAKAHLDLGDATEFDPLVEGYIAAAIGHVEAYTGLRLGAQTLALRACGFDDTSFLLPAAPVQEVTSITYRDTEGADQTLPTSVYGAVLAGLSPLLYLKAGQSFPAVCAEPGAVVITAVCGYAADLCPPPIVQALKLLVADWFSNREAPGSSSPVVDALLCNFRRH